MWVKLSFVHGYWIWMGLIVDGPRADEGRRGSGEYFGLMREEALGANPGVKRCSSCHSIHSNILL